jgi:hypothetical protein
MYKSRLRMKLLPSTLMSVSAMKTPTMLSESMNRPQGGLRQTCRAIIFGVVMLSLVASLATRTFRLSIGDGTEVKTSSTNPIRQHLDKDAVEFTAPAPLFVSYQAPGSHVLAASAESPLPPQSLGDTLYNRPPPLS